MFIHALIRMRGVWLNGPRAGTRIEIMVPTHCIVDGQLVPHREQFDWLIAHGSEVVER